MMLQSTVSGNVRLEIFKKAVIKFNKQPQKMTVSADAWQTELARAARRKQGSRLVTCALCWMFLWIDPEGSTALRRQEVKTPLLTKFRLPLSYIHTHTHARTVR